jgi:bifunctional oligoribonuclease and PAP phosphatase NrnA
MLAHTDAQLKNLLVKTHNRLAGSSHVLLISGDHPDGDSLGSLVALKHYLDLLGKKTTCFSASPIPENLTFLPLPEIIYSVEEIPKDIDVAISADHSDIEQTGLVTWLKMFSPHLINIDHHRGNARWGDTNIVTIDASAACELVYNLFRINNIPLTKEVANSLLTGLMTDTGNFGNPATSSTAMAMGSALIKYGGKPQTVLDETFKNKTLPSLKLWGDIIHQIEHNKKLGVAVVVITYDQLKKFNATEEWLDGLSNFLTVLSDAQASLVFREIEPNTFRGSFRTTRDNVDVGRLAELLGGGGHQKAAGFSLEGILAKKEDCWYIR